MAITDLKLTEADYTGKGGAALPALANSSGVIKDKQSVLIEKLDELAKMIGLENFNDLVDALVATTGASEIGAVAPTGLTGANVQAILDSMRAYFVGAGTGLGDMVQSVYDPTAQAKDVFAEIALKVNTADVKNVLTDTSTDKPLSAAQGKALQDGKINITDIADDLITDNAAKVLSAKQGKVLQDNKVNISDVKNVLTDTSTDKPLSAAQGKALNDSKVIAPATNTDAYIPQWNGVNSKELKNGLSLQDIILAVYPVGSIYMSVSSTSPDTLFGGTWVAWGAGRVPVGIDSTQTEFDTVEETGGEKTHKLIAGETPNLQGDLFAIATGGSESGGYAAYGDGRSSRYNINSDGGQAHNNLQPYITCYMWKRTA